MVGRLLELLFGCSHRNLSRPVTSVYDSGEPAGQSYVVCLDCGKEFAYDVKSMRRGKPIHRAADSMAHRMEQPVRRKGK